MAIGIINGKINEVTLVNNVTDLASAVTTAKAGDTIRIAPGTYTLTSSLVIPSGVTLQGSGVGQTTLYGAFADALIKMENASVGPYGVAALTAWANSGTTDTAGDATNINDGDILFLQDGGGSEKFTSTAFGNGNPGTGAYKLRHEVPIAFNVSSTLTVYNVYSSDIVIEKLTLLGDSSNTTNGISITGGKNICVRDVKIKNCVHAPLLLQSVVESNFEYKGFDSTNNCLRVVAGGITDCKVSLSSYNCATAANSVVVMYSYYSDLSVVTFGSTPSDTTFNFNLCQRNIIRVISSTTAGVRTLQLNSSDDNIVHCSSQMAVLDSGTGNQITST